ncbi:hypothetical protein [Teichococcus vastitatis]|uniref:Uncharacterized protein n=1 Tax=Teichococcus vastitatis TaxID=2307076 RepID=A0ABS9WBT1_9PROT|nr:hypothetical protein [Pseudoroseomonas vastitatis]MCI0756692.1 hypothetical protein [Pseudoroseomonas vastitatis]
MNEQDQKIIQRGIAAQELLENEAFQAVRYVVEQGYLSSIMTTGLEDGETREKLFRKVHALRELTVELNDWVFQKNSREDRLAQGDDFAED